jgi:DnaJ-class molecular chaperone
LPVSGGHRKGDLYLAIEVHIPERLTADERQLYERLRALGEADSVPKDRGAPRSRKHVVLDGAEEILLGSSSSVVRKPKREGSRCGASSEGASSPGSVGECSWGGLPLELLDQPPQELLSLEELDAIVRV